MLAKRVRHLNFKPMNLITGFTAEYQQSIKVKMLLFSITRNDRREQNARGGIDRTSCQQRK